MLRRLAANAHSYREDKVLHLVCLSVCPAPTVRWKSECRAHLFGCETYISDVYSFWALVIEL